MKILSILTAIVFTTTLSFAGVKDGDCGNGNPHGDVTVDVSGGIHGDYHVTFSDDVGSSPSTTATPTMGGDAGEVEDTDWSTTSTTNDDGTTTTGGTYRVKDGKLQKKNDNGDAVNVGPCKKKKKKTGSVLNVTIDNSFVSDDEYVGTLP